MSFYAKGSAETMDSSSRYWKIYRISLTRKAGYEDWSVPTAKEFFGQNFANSSNLRHRELLVALNSYFQPQHSGVEATNRAQAGLCLRCYVSHPILKACQKINNLFAGEKSFTYRDLLPFVLNDDGKILILLDKDGKTQIELKDGKIPEKTAYKYFTVEILRSYKYNSQSSMSLDNWAYLKTKQNKELQDFLSEYGFKALSDWALINRARPKQLERLSKIDRQLVEVFHGVYRRDRPQQRQQGIRKCPEPNEAQLTEMLARLQDKQVPINTPVELLKALKQLATQLRQYNIWSSRESLELYDPDTGSYAARPDLPTDSLNELELEQRSLREFLHQQLKLALIQAIEQGIGTRITKLQKSKKYGPLAPNFLPGLQLYYCQSLSLSEIAPQLGMTGWDQARRILNPGDLLNQVRTLTVQQLLEKILEKAHSMGLTKIPPEPEYLRNLSEEIEAFTDAEVFQSAVAEIKAGKNRSLDSLYAQQLRNYLKKHR